MDDNFILIEINGITYYIEASRISDLAFIDNELVNVSNSSITLVHSFDTTTTYPRITCSPMSQCVLRSSQQSTQIGVTSNYSLVSNKFNMNMLTNSNQNTLLMAMLFLIILFKLLWKK